MSIFANNSIFFSWHNFFVNFFVILDGMCNRSEYLSELSKVWPKYNSIHAYTQQQKTFSQSSLILFSNLEADIRDQMYFIVGYEPTYIR